MKVYFSSQTFESIEEASEKLGMPSGLIDFMTKNKCFPRICLENQIQMQIDGVNYCDSEHIKNDFGVKEKDFFFEFGERLSIS